MIKIDMWYNDKKEQVTGLDIWFNDSVQEICEAFPHLEKKINACLN